MIATSCQVAYDAGLRKGTYECRNSDIVHPIYRFESDSALEYFSPDIHKLQFNDIRTKETMRFDSINLL
ncbi:hypothetical protein COV16_02675 [Candidatus Woesearchaeota archaeon CG10_big_fil_rev_8_21_14_0_10_34_8]|nr:MAG: hypothetical protein COV16_02675 [Candidatus Woesearchaeota archaeon CG10_big_fil_rev_8_21_14_0_10_34_8]